jgi:hypothetical protein
MNMSPVLLLAPAFLQAAAMGVDEGIWHRRRGLPRWERIGHPIDTLSTAACYAWLSLVPPNVHGALAGYIALCATSCLIITKDEPVHARLCGAGECWVHAVLFVLHPIVFMAFAMIWMSGRLTWLLWAQCGLTIAFAAYQFGYWRFRWKRYPSAV